MDFALGHQETPKPPSGGFYLGVLKMPWENGAT